MWRLAVFVCLAECLPASPASYAADQVLTETRQIGPYLRRCSMPPAGKPPEIAAEITIAFALRRDGSVVGEPRIVYLSPEIPEGWQEAYRLSALKMLDICTPAPLSPALGAAMAGRQQRLRLIDHGTRQKDTHPWRTIPKTPWSWKRQRDV